MEVLARPFFNIAVIDAPLEKLVHAFQERGPDSVGAAPTPFVFPRQPYQASEGDAPMLLWSPANQPGLTAFMPQVQSGDYFVVEFSGRDFRHRVASVRSTTQDVEWPINELDVYENGARTRVVQAMRDSPKWVFHEDGEPLAFEQTGRYNKHRIRDRLDRALLFSYLEAWGARIREPDFWRTSKEAFTFTRRPNGSG